MAPVSYEIKSKCVSKSYKVPQNRPKLFFYHCFLPLMLFPLPIAWKVASLHATLQLLHFLCGPNTWQLSLHSPSSLPPSRPTPCVPTTLGSCLSHCTAVMIADVISFCTCSCALELNAPVLCASLSCGTGT